MPPKPERLAPPALTWLSDHQVLIWDRRLDRAAGSQRLCQRAQDELGLGLGRLLTTRLWIFSPQLRADECTNFVRTFLCDPVLQAHSVEQWPALTDFSQLIAVRPKPGVTDDSVQLAAQALREQLGLDSANAAGERPLLLRQDLFWLIGADGQTISALELQRFASAYLANPLLHHVQILDPLQLPAMISAITALIFAPHDVADKSSKSQEISLELSDEALLELSRQRVLALNLDELHTLREHFRDPQRRRWRHAQGLPAGPTDCELEVFAQSWSEHCKHKEFNARIEHVDLDSGQHVVIDGLLDSYVRGATREIQKNLQAAGADWLVKVFDDNAGVVRIDDERLFVWKVETHNAPSALDPYGGALTGILGNNRDPLGTGRGGAQLLFNTDVLCFGLPEIEAEPSPPQLHPLRILRGVRQGIEDGGNKSGIPTINGALLFDPSYRGKPLVFCGTGAIMSKSYAGQLSWVKEVFSGDRVVMIGGRVGRDGIHGATFSSTRLDKEAPSSAVQIGSPLTQKKLSDFLRAATKQGLVRCTTDNGAGGLASSVGELAPLAGGVAIDLAKVPLKYPGLEPWEIVVSESQERMTLAVDPQHVQALQTMALSYDVEFSDLGAFNDSGRFDLFFGAQWLGALDLAFLHHGLPQKIMRSEWATPILEPPRWPENLDLAASLLQLLASPNICSRESLVRQFDHEVQGRSVVKSFMGAQGHAPQDAAVQRLDFAGWAGLIVSNGIAPRYGLLDPYAMSAGSFDKAVRQIIAVGGRLPEAQDPTAPWWSACDNFCMPDSAYDAAKNPQGARKMGALVRMNQALFDVATAYGVPLTSGKDSMKNDLEVGDQRISVMPTVLYSVVAGMDDIRRAVTTEFKRPGDAIFVLGETYNELGGSALLQALDQLGRNAPQLRPARAKDLYQRISRATGQGLVASCHDLGLGGLAVALAECCIGSGLGAELNLAAESSLASVAPEDRSVPEVSSALVQLYSESHSRFVATVAPQDIDAFVAILGDRAQRLGQVQRDPVLILRQGQQQLFRLSVSRLQEAWTRASACHRAGL